MIAANALFERFDAYARNRFLGRLGISFARFIHSFGTTEPCVLLACVLVSELESRGHTCLALEDLESNPCEKLRFENDHWQQLCKDVGNLPATVAEWKLRLAQCPQVMLDGQEDRGQPLVLHGDRLYLRRYWMDEMRLAQSIAKRVAVRRDVDVVKVHMVLDALFADADAPAEVDWQKVACAVAVRGALTIITGGPGTGKTYSVASLLALLVELSDAPASLRVVMAAPSGKAAARLQESILKSFRQVAGKVSKTDDMNDFMARLPSPKTLHSLIGLNPAARKPRHTAARPLDLDVLIVDEASMAHLEMMTMILDALPEQAMLIILGDKDQLASVEAGAVLGDLCHGSEKCHYTEETAEYVRATCGQTIPTEFIGSGTALAQQIVMLRRSRRFKGAIGALALAVNAGDCAASALLLCSCTENTLFAKHDVNQVASAALIAPKSVEHAPADFTQFFAALENPVPRNEVERLEWSRSLYWDEHASQEAILTLAMEGRKGISDCYGAFFRILRDRPADPALQPGWIRQVLETFDRFRILAAVRDGIWGVAGINEAIEHHAVQAKQLKPTGQWYHGRPVIITRTSHDLDVHNGDVGVCLEDVGRPGAMRVYMAKGEELRSISAARLSHVETAFAMTVHKVQGSEFEHVALVLPARHNPVLSRELVYTGITRAKATFTLLTPEAAILDKAIQKTADRTSGLRSILNDVLRLSQENSALAA